MTQLFDDKLSTAIRLSFPVINVSTFESSRAAAVMEKLAKKSGKAFVELPFKFLPNMDGLARLMDENKKAEGATNGFVFFDQFFSDRLRSNPDVMPALKSALDFLENKGINYVIAGKDAINEEFVYHAQLPPMEDQEIAELVGICERFIKTEGELFSEEERRAIVAEARGLSQSQMKNVFTYCAWLKKEGREFQQEIRVEKAHILRDVGLDVLAPVPLEQVGGLENLKAFLQTRRAGWDAGLPAKGILLAGVPGGGKTLAAKAAASVLGASLVRLDVGRFYSKFLGETEKLFSRALATVEEISPVVMLIDEIEKFFGAAEGEHEVSRRLLGTFLYWLQERRGKVFVVATANQLNRLPPELMRAGRWDRTFFFDLPTPVERQKIYEIHIAAAGGKAQEFFLEALVKRSEGYTGAEIEQAVLDARYLAVGSGENLGNPHILAAMDMISPTSVTRRDDINRIRALGTQGFYPANQPVTGDADLGVE